MVGRASRLLVSVGFSALWLLGFQTSCSSSSDGGASATCTARCSDLCKALSACDTPPADCQAQCTLGLGADCAGPPADQLTCKELSATYACADYCATLCTRAPECGSFDSRKCAIGCASESPTICNPASVAARTCDQLKPELRSYQETAEIEQSGGHVSSGHFGPSYGLCESAEDCELPLGCASATNTCAACDSDADCARTYPHYACSAAHECTKVDCVVDADCSIDLTGQFCDPTLHVCGECHSDADCKGVISGTVCDEAKLKCVQCVDNGDCSNDAPRCEASLQYCTSCKTDADCKGRSGTPFCDFTCVECKSDADCTDDAKPTCDTAYGKCK